MQFHNKLFSLAASLYIISVNTARNTFPSMLCSCRFHFLPVSVCRIRSPNSRKKSLSQDVYISWFGWRSL